MATIKKISELEQLEVLSDSSNIIIEENGVAKRFSAINISGNNDGVGEKTENGGEIFNDYENNIAGTRGYAIKGYDEDNRTYTLVRNNSNDGLDDLAGKNIKYSIVWGSNYYDAGEIVTVDRDTVTVTTDYNINGESKNSLIFGDLNTEEKVFFIVSRPDLGDILINNNQHAEGTNTQAFLRCAHSEGRDTKAIGKYSHAEGRSTEAHYCAHTEGEGTVALGHYSHAEGYHAQTSGRWSHAEGERTAAIGEASHSEGRSTQSSGTAAHSEGLNAKALGTAAHAEGESTEASGFDSHAEGKESKSSGQASHSEGNKTKATGYASHAEGLNTVASGQGSHAENLGAKAVGDYSHAGGYQTKAGYEAQTVIGKFNDNKSNSLFEIGNGIDNDTRSNAFAVYTEGYAEVKTQGTTPNSVVTRKFVLDNIDKNPAGKTTEQGGEIFNDYTTNQATSPYSHAEGQGTIASATASHAEGYATLAEGVKSHAEGQGTLASGQASHAEGVDTKAKNYAAHAEGSYTTADAINSHAEGYNTKAIGEASHSEGVGTKAIGKYSHAEGLSTEAKGDTSHSEGQNSVAEGITSHAEGFYTVAKGAYSHAGGQQTIAGYEAQTVVGKLNDNKSDTLFEVGNGADKDHRSNAFEVYRDGHAELQAQGTTNNSVVIKQTLDNLIGYGSLEELENLNPADPNSPKLFFVID